MINAVVVRHRGSVVKIPFENINFVKADNKYVDVSTNQQTYLSEKSIKQFEKELPVEEFIRIHRNCLVRKSLIESVATKGPNNNAEVKLTTGDVLSVSRRSTPVVRKYLRSTGNLKK